MKRFGAKKVLMIIFFGAAAILVFGLVVMGLWNAILPAVLGVKTITFVQALGILLLSKILFGGFHGSKHEWKRKMEDKWKSRMEEKLAGMTPEEKEKFKAEWKNRCGAMGWGMPKQKEEGQQSNPM